MNPNTGGRARRSKGAATTGTRHLAVLHSNDMQEDFLAEEQAGDRPGWRTAYYPNGWHIMDRDLQAEVMYRDVEAWLRDSQAPLLSGAGPVLPALEAAQSRRPAP